MTQPLVFRPTATQNERVESIDILRGLVIIIMALDHVRDYFHASSLVFNPTDLAHTSPGIFFTRWITHFCAPVFVLLAGVSARLQVAKKGKKKLAGFLFVRGIWLVFLEFTVITFAWTFNPNWNIVILQVIWAIGISMIALSAIILLPPGVALVVGLAMVGGHNLFDSIHMTGHGAINVIWSFLHIRNYYMIGPLRVLYGYPVLPWMGIMFLGYTLGFLYTADVSAASRKKSLIWLGMAATMLFVLIRFLNRYGDASSWSMQRSGVFDVISFVNTTKYPPSLLYTLMTLGPALILLAVLENWRFRSAHNHLSRILSVFGRVPMFYYVIHIYLIHVLAMGAAVSQGFPASAMIFSSWVSENSKLKGYGYNLWMIYAIWMGIIIILYPLCRQYDQFKRSHKQLWWLSFL